jgi:hypothetical protein
VGEPRILVLVLSIDREPWRTIETAGQRETWAAPETRPPGCEVVFYYGRNGIRRYPGRIAARLMRMNGSTATVARGSENASFFARAIGSVGERSLARISTRAAAAPCELVGDRLLCPVPEVYALTLPKLLAALRWAVSDPLGEFDYIYRTNTSSYVNLWRLQSVAAELPRARCYAGWIVRRPSDGLPFVTGSGILMSRDVAQAFAEHTSWNWGTIDDGALGEAAAAIGLRPIELDRLRVRDAASVDDLTEERLLETYNFRCKAVNRTDYEAMLAIHRRLTR